ncbi:hypothetical protein VCHENC02_0285B, partial [Vibrio harveyi]
PKKRSCSCFTPQSWKLNPYSSLQTINIFLRDKRKVARSVGCRRETVLY